MDCSVEVSSSSVFCLSVKCLSGFVSGTTSNRGSPTLDESTIVCGPIESTIKRASIVAGVTGRRLSVRFRGVGTELMGLLGSIRG